MRQRTSQRLPDRAIIKRDQQTGENELGEPIFETVTIADNVPCAYSPQSTSFVREDSGERVQRPATIRFAADIDIQEGDTITVDTADKSFEARGIEEIRDHRRGTTVVQRVEVERA